MSQSLDIIAHYLNVTLLPTIIVVGLVANILSILTWSSGTHRRTSTSVLLTSLAVVDIGVLCMPALEFWTLETFNLSIRNVNTLLCKLFSFSSVFAPAMSSWIIVLVTYERLISIWLPVKVRYLCTRRKVAGAVVLVALMLTALYSPFLMSWQLVEKQDSNMSNMTSHLCYISSSDTVYTDYRTAWLWLDLCALFVAPFLLIAIANSLILTKVLSRKTIMLHDRCIVYPTRVANCFTVRAIALSITFCVCTSPVTIYAVYREYAGPEQPSKFGWVVTLLLLYCNSCVNFFLYCAIGKGFRSDMKTVLNNLCVKRTLAAVEASYSRKQSLFSNFVHASRDTLYTAPT